MKVLVTGASGLLGKKLVDRLSKTHEVIGTYRERRINDSLFYLDITDTSSIESLVESVRPEAIVHAASLVDVDLCEREPSLARRVNVEGSENVAKAARHIRAKMIYISSDYVFDGKSELYKEDHVKNPVNVYGSTKAEAEDLVMKIVDNSAIIRPTLLFGEGDSFVSRIREKLLQGCAIKEDNNLVKYPLLVDDVANATKMMLEEDHSGIFHLCGPEATTRYRSAIKIAAQHQLQTELISESENYGHAIRPQNVKLDDGKIKRLGFKYLRERMSDSLKVIRNQEGCTFRRIYSDRPDKLTLGQSASDFRIQLGKRMALEHPAEADIVVPIPESGIFLAAGYSDQSKLPWYPGIIRDYETAKTLFMPTVAMRSSSLEKKLKAVPDVVSGKNLVLIDEAIIAGTTLAVVIDKLKNAGARDIHVRIPSPPMTYNCTSGVLLSDASLIAKEYGPHKEKIEKELRERFGVKSLYFISLEGFLGSLKNRTDSCSECFGGSRSGL